MHPKNNLTVSTRHSRYIQQSNSTIFLISHYYIIIYLLNFII